VNECKVSKKAIINLLAIYFFTQLLLLATTPFTYSEANILFRENLTIDWLIESSIFRYTESVLMLRLPYFIISLGIFYLLLEIIKEYFKEFSSYYNLTIVIFLITPGIFLSFILVNHATIPIFLTLLFIFSYKRDLKIAIIISLVLLFFTHTAQFVLYLAVALYSYKDKRWSIVILSLALVLFVSIESKYAIDGIPKGHLLQLFGIYAAIFSPLLFIANLYAIFKNNNY